MSFPHNPAHEVGTCSKCGNEMIFNVPRMGARGVFIHKNSGNYMCGGHPAPQVPRNLETLTGDARGALRAAGWSDEDILRVIPLSKPPGITIDPEILDCVRKLVAHLKDL